MFPTFYKPLILSIELNTFCGLNCVFCPNGYFIKKELDDSVFKILLEYIAGRNNLTTVAISGGEPLIDPRLETLLSICEMNNIPSSIDTNCTWNDLPVIISKCNQIRVKLFSLDEKKHDLLVGKMGNYKKVVWFIKWLFDNFQGSKVLLFPLLRQNLDEMKQVAEYAIDLGFYCNFFPYPRKFGNAALDIQEFNLATRNLEILFKKYQKYVFIDIPLVGSRNKSLKNICPAIFISTHIDVDGYLRLCKYFPERVGSLKESSLIDLWNTQLKYINNINMVCSTCNTYSNCGGGCLANKNDFGLDYYCRRNINE